MKHKVLTFAIAFGIMILGSSFITHYSKIQPQDVSGKHYGVLYYQLNNEDITGEYSGRILSFNSDYTLTVMVGGDPVGSDYYKEDDSQLYIQMNNESDYSDLTGAWKKMGKDPKSGTLQLEKASGSGTPDQLVLQTNE